MRAAVYARISLDRSGEALGVERQVQDCKNKAAAMGWQVHDTYIDNDLSASSGKPRPEYERMLGDLEKGTIKAVVVYDLDRLTRRPAELEAFIDLADRLKVSLANVSGDVDLTTSSGRMIARIKGAVARQEAERIGERVARQKRQRAEQGLPQGGRERLYGYTRDWQVIEDEAEIIREAFQRRALGESTTAIARDFSGRGVCTVSGRPWTGGTLGSTLTKAGYAGLREFKGEIIGPTSYPSIIEESLWYRTQAALQADSRGKNSRRHLLSGFLICEACGTAMKGAVSKQRGDRYRCAANYGGCGTTSIKSDWVKVPVVDAVMRHVRARQEPVVAAPRPDYEAEVQRLTGEIREAQNAVKTGTLSMALVAPILTSLEEQRDEILDKMADHDADTLKPWFLTERLSWWRMNLSQRRAFLDRYMDRVLIAPSPTRGRNSIDLSRIEVHFKDGTVERLSNDLLPLLEEPEEA